MELWLFRIKPPICNRTVGNEDACNNASSEWWKMTVVLFLWIHICFYLSDVCYHSPGGVELSQPDRLISYKDIYTTWLLYGIMFLYFSTPLWCFCSRTFFSNYEFDKVPWKSKCIWNGHLQIDGLFIPATMCSGHNIFNNIYNGSVPCCYRNSVAYIQKP